MSKRLIDRKTCAKCGQVIDITEDSVEHGHAGACQVQEPEPELVEQAGLPPAAKKRG